MLGRERRQIRGDEKGVTWFIAPRSASPLADDLSDVAERDDWALLYPVVPDDPEDEEER